MGRGCQCSILLLAALSAAAIVVCSLATPVGAETGGRSRCVPTEENIEGPYYLHGAPFREKIAPAGASGRLLFLSGRVFAADCVTLLPGAVVDLWQTGASGKYDFSEDFRWRGRVRTDGEGRYRFETVIPGRYRTGKSYRPAHIHLKISHPRGRTLVTQIYFEEDPHLAADPFVRRSLIVPLHREEGSSGEAWSASFNIILAAPGNN